MVPTFVSQIVEKRMAGKSGLQLEGNTSDRYTSGELDIKPNSLCYFLAEYYGRRGYHVARFSQAGGLQILQPAGHTAEGRNPFIPSPGNNLEALVHQRNSEPRNYAIHLDRLTPILRGPQKCLLLLDYAEQILPQAEGLYLEPERQIILENIHRWGIDDQIKSSLNLIMLVCYEGTTNSLLTRSGAYARIQIPLPSFQERREFIRLLTESRNPSFGSLEPGLSIDECSRLTNGLRLIDEEMMFRTRAGGVITRSDIRSTKTESIKEQSGGLLVVHEPQRGFESIAGLAHVKSKILEIMWQFRNDSTTAPYAIGFWGPPGGGKTYIVEAIAKEIDLPLLEIKTVHSPWVGSSEEHMDKILMTVDGQGPCIVFIDEIDQWGIGQRGQQGDSGVSDRLTKKFWEHLGRSSNRGKFLYVFASNRPDRLDDAMYDRIQVHLAFLHPTPTEGAAIMRSLATQLAREFSEDVDCLAIARSPHLKLATIRGISEIVTSAARRADYRAGKVRSVISNADLVESVRLYKPTYDRRMHEYLALRAIRMVPFGDCLPWMTKDGIQPGAEIPEYLEGIVNSTTGEVDLDRLNARIMELEVHLLQNRLMR